VQKAGLNLTDNVRSSSDLLGQRTRPGVDGINA
jgi:hypothetical protein